MSVCLVWEHGEGGEGVSVFVFVLVCLAEREGVGNIN